MCAHYIFHLHCVICTTTRCRGGRGRRSCDWSGQLQLVSLSVSALANSWRPLSAEGGRGAGGQGATGLVLKKMLGRAVNCQGNSATAHGSVARTTTTETKCAINLPVTCMCVCGAANRLPLLLFVYICMSVFMPLCVWVCYKVPF